MTTREQLTCALARVQAQVARLEADVAGVVAASEGANSDDEHDPEGATIAFERAQLAALLRGARARAAEIRQALESVDDARYGRCAQCGEPIGQERMAARPGVTSCVACAAGRR